MCSIVRRPEQRCRYAPLAVVAALGACLHAPDAPLRAAPDTLSRRTAVPQTPEAALLLEGKLLTFAIGKPPTLRGERDLESLLPEVREARLARAERGRVVIFTPGRLLALDPGAAPRVWQAPRGYVLGAVASYGERLVVGLGRVRGEGEPFSPGLPFELRVSVLDSELRLLGEALFRLPKNQVFDKRVPHAMLVHGTRAYVLDNIATPAYVFCVELARPRQPTIAQPLRLDGVNMHLSAQWLDPVARRWAIIDEENNLTGLTQVLNLVDLARPSHLAESKAIFHHARSPARAGNDAPASPWKIAAVSPLAPVWAVTADRRSDEVQLSRLSLAGATPRIEPRLRLHPPPGAARGGAPGRIFDSFQLSLHDNLLLVSTARELWLVDLTDANRPALFAHETTESLQRVLGRPLPTLEGALLR